MARTTIAEEFVGQLADLGVDHLYGITGDSLNAIADAMRRGGRVRWIHTRHEEAAAFAAAAEAHLTERLAVCAGSCGPGNLHLINGLFDAHRSRVPVLALAAQIPTSEIGSGYFQETHPQELFRECSAYAELVSDTTQFSRVFERALRTAVGESDVAVVVLPGDLAWEAAPEASDTPPVVGAPGAPVPPSEALDRAAAVLNGAKRVTILAGAGCAHARPELLRVAAQLRAPIVHTIRGKEFVEYDNPFDVGMTGLLGFRSGYAAMGAADVLVMLGTDFPYRQFYPDRATVVQVDRRADQIGRRTTVAVPLVGDVARTLQALQPKLTPKTDGTHLEGALANYAKARADLDDLARGEAGTTPIHPQYVARVLDSLAAPDALFACDVGTPTVWAARYLRMNGRRRLVGSFVHGSMANALPQAIGAQVAFPDRQVVAMAGDGGLAMLLGELLTLRQHRLPVKIVVFNNGALGFVELEMKSAGLLEFATDLDNPDFAEVARAAGLFGVRAVRPEEVGPAITAALAHPGPALVDVVVNRLELAMPPSLTWGEASGFALFLAKAILNGKGNEVVDLASSNWLH